MHDTNICFIILLDYAYSFFLSIYLYLSLSIYLPIYLHPSPSFDPSTSLSLFHSPSHTRHRLIVRRRSCYITCQSWNSILLPNIACKMLANFSFLTVKNQKVIIISRVMGFFVTYWPHYVTYLVCDTFKVLCFNFRVSC